MGHGSYVKVDRVRRFLRRLPEDVRAPISDVIKKTSDAILLDAQTSVPQKTGTLKRALSAKQSRDGMTVQIGIRGKRAQRKAFYAAFVEFGTRGYSAGETRRTRNSKTTKKISRRVPARRARPFLYPAVDKNVSAFQKDMADAMSKTINKIISTP